MAKSQGLEWRTIKKPLDLQKALDASLIDLIELVKKHLHTEPYTIEVYRQYTPGFQHMNIEW